MINRGKNATVIRVGIFETDQEVMKIPTGLSGDGKDESLITVRVFEILTIIKKFPTVIRGGKSLIGRGYSREDVILLSIAIDQRRRL